MKTSSHKYHVVHVVQSLDVGGMENGIVNIANIINKDKFKLTICCLSHKGALANRIVDNGVSLICMDWKGGVDLNLFWSLAKIFRDIGADIVHTHGWLSFVYGAVASKLSGIKVLINGEHGTFNLDKTRRIIAYRLLSLFVSKFLTVSLSLKAELKKTLFIRDEKIVTIPNGVDAEKFRPRSSEEIQTVKRSIGIPVTAKVIGSVGRLEPVKNYEMLIQAFQELYKEFPRLYCIFIGEGSCRARLENLADSLGIKERVLFLGKMNEPQDALPVMDIFVLTSFSEGMSNTILEAMACSIPVVATNVGGNSEMVTKEINGYLVDSGNIIQLCNCIRVLLTEDSRRLEYGANSRNIVKNEYELNKMVSKYENVYLELMGKNVR